MVASTPSLCGKQMAIHMQRYTFFAICDHLAIDIFATDYQVVIFFPIFAQKTYE